MKQVISGKLKEQPVVQEKRNRKTGEKVSVLSFTLLAEDDAAPEVEVDGMLQKKRIMEIWPEKSENWKKEPV